jgi:hypothetical protein
VLAGRSRHGFCPQSQMIRGVLSPGPAWRQLIADRGTTTVLRNVDADSCRLRPASTGQQRPPRRQFPSAPRRKGNHVFGHGYGTVDGVCRARRPGALIFPVQVIFSLGKNCFLQVIPWMSQLPIIWGCCNCELGLAPAGTSAGRPWAGPTGH